MPKLKSNLCALSLLPALCACASNPRTDTANGAAGTDTGMDTERPAEQTAGATGAEQHILNLGEHALSAIAQLDACVDILKSDRAILSAQ